MRTRHSAAAAATAVAALLVLAGCARDPAAAGAPTAAESSVPAPSGTPLGAPGTSSAMPAQAQVLTTPSACAPDGWDCAQAVRFDAVAGYVTGRPGQLGVVLRDRTTGAVWRTGATSYPMWTASTIKVAIATTLLERQRAGKIRLTSSDRRAMSDMLRASSNDAADTLWKRYDGPKMLDRFRSGYGMTGLSVVKGEETYWRNLRCTADDLDRLMTYVLGGALHPDDRAYLVDALRTVADNQHWGTLAVDSDLHPGNKDGWAFKPDPGGEHWVTHTAGFAGPGERYVIIVMYTLPPSGTLRDGVQAVSDVAALMFGSPTPAKVTPPAG